MDTNDPGPAVAGRPRVSREPPSVGAPTSCLD